jgi:uncharacterized protein DUF6174
MESLPLVQNGDSMKSHIATRPLALGLLLVGLSGCGGGQRVTPEAIARAKQTWQQAGIKNYNLEWVSTGQNRSHYRVFVRDGQVRKVYSILPDKREIEMHPARPSFYSIEGLFVVIEDELAQLKSDTPFGQPKGTRAVLRFTADPKLGYPQRYERDVGGTRQGVSIEVVKLEINPPEAIPPPAS